MTINVGREDIVRMVLGTAPHYTVFDNDLVKRCGSYIGGFHDGWAWDLNSLDDLTNQELIDLYDICKNSWK